MALTTQGTRRFQIEQEEGGGGEGEGGEKKRGGVVFLVVVIVFVLLLLFFHIRYNCTIHLSHCLINSSSVLTPISNRRSFSRLTNGHILIAFDDQDIYTFALRTCLLVLVN